MVIHCIYSESHLIPVLSAAPLADYINFSGGVAVDDSNSLKE